MLIIDGIEGTVAVRPCGKGGVVAGLRFKQTGFAVHGLNPFFRMLCVAAERCDLICRQYFRPPAERHHLRMLVVDGVPMQMIGKAEQNAVAFFPKPPNRKPLAGNRHAGTFFIVDKRRSVLGPTGYSETQAEFRVLFR